MSIFTNSRTKAAARASATPILDLLEPLPTPDSEKINGRFAAPFLASVAMIVIVGNPSFLVVPFGFLLINFLTILLHESGHLVAGWLVGLRFIGVRVDPFFLRLDGGRWKFSLRPRLFWGFALMKVDKIRRMKRRLAICTLGGPITSLFFGLGAFVAGEIGRARYDSSIWPTFLDCLGAWSFLLGCVSLIPARVRGFANDGTLLRSLLFRKSESKHLIASQALATVDPDAIFPPDYFPRWLRMAADSTAGSDYYTSWLNYKNDADADQQAQHLERCLAFAGHMDEKARDKLIAEAASFCAYRRNDLHKAEIWETRLRSPDQLHPISKLRLEAAICCARGNLDQALETVDRGLALVDHSPETASSAEFEREWRTWQEELRLRMATVS